MLKNAWLLEDQVKAKTGDLRWMSLMTVRHPMARLYSAWKDKFRKGQPWLKVIEHQFKVKTTNLHNLKIFFSFLVLSSAFGTKRHVSL